MKSFLFSSRLDVFLLVSLQTGENKKDFTSSYAPLKTAPDCLTEMSSSSLTSYYKIMNCKSKTLIQAGILKSIPGIMHGFGVRGVDVKTCLDEMGIRNFSIPLTNQMHGKNVHDLKSPLGGNVLQGDAFVTGEPKMVCFVRTADCVPILIVDAKRGAIAAIHAGWRGTAANIAGHTLDAMRKAFGTRPEDCLAAIGPRICGSCYEVGPEVIDALGKLPIGCDWLLGRRKVDMGIANRLLLENSGIALSKIEVLPCCTMCDKIFASYRRDKSESERQFNFVVVE